jgi:hypothetical protein
MSSFNKTDSSVMWNNDCHTEVHSKTENISCGSASFGLHHSYMVTLNSPFCKCDILILREN